LEIVDSNWYFRRTATA